MSLFDHDQDYDGPSDRAALDALRILDSWALARGMPVSRAHEALTEVFGEKVPKSRDKPPYKPTAYQTRTKMAVVAALEKLKTGPKYLTALRGPGMKDPMLARQYLAAVGCTFERPGNGYAYLVTGPEAK